MREENILRAPLALAISLVLVGLAFYSFGQQIPITKKRAFLIKPDLAVTDIRADKECFLAVEVKNAGTLAVDSPLALRVIMGGRTVFDEKIRFNLATRGDSGRQCPVPGCPAGPMSRLWWMWTKLWPNPMRTITV